jgi:hypothetical protein
VRNGLWILACVWPIALFALVGGATLAFAQAGSTGGTIGKTDKSVSGGEEQTPERKTAGQNDRAVTIDAVACRILLDADVR